MKITIGNETINIERRISREYVKIETLFKAIEALKEINFFDIKSNEFSEEYDKLLEEYYETEEYDEEHDEFYYDESIMKKINKMKEDHDYEWNSLYSTLENEYNISFNETVFTNYDIKMDELTDFEIIDILIYGGYN